MGPEAALIACEKRLAVGGPPTQSRAWGQRGIISAQRPPVVARPPACIPAAAAPQSVPSDFDVLVDVCFIDAYGVGHSVMALCVASMLEGSVGAAAKTVADAGKCRSNNYSSKSGGRRETAQWSLGCCHLWHQVAATGA